MITLSIKDLKTKKVKIKCFNSLDKAKKEGMKVINSASLHLAGASYDLDEEKKIVENLYILQEAQEGHKR